MTKETETDFRPSLLRRNSIAGLVARVFFFLFVMLIALALALSFCSASGLKIESKIVIAMWLAVTAPIAVSVVCGELPRGNDWVLVRLGIATFCRTGLPLLIVIFVDRVSEGKLVEPAYGFLAFFYFVGFLISVWVSVSRSRLADSIDEVDRAVI